MMTTPVEELSCTVDDGMVVSAVSVPVVVPGPGCRGSPPP